MGQQRRLFVQTLLHGSARLPCVCIGRMDQHGGMSAEAAAVEASVYFDVRGALKIETLPGEADVRMVSMLSPSSFSLGADV